MGGGGRGLGPARGLGLRANIPISEYLHDPPVHVALGKQPGHCKPLGILAKLLLVPLKHHVPSLQVRPALDGLHLLVRLQFVAELGELGQHSLDILSASLVSENIVQSSKTVCVITT